MHLHLVATLFLGSWLSSWPATVAAQDAPLFIQGGFEGATVTDDAVYNSGGSIQVNGFDMAVPKNLLVQFPAAWVPWKDFVASKDDFLGFETLVGWHTDAFLRGILITPPGHGQLHQRRASRSPSRYPRVLRRPLQRVH